MWLRTLPIVYLELWIPILWLGPFSLYILLLRLAFIQLMSICNPSQCGFCFWYTNLANVDFFFDIPNYLYLSKRYTKLSLIEIPPDFYAEHYNQRLNEQALESRLSCIGLFSICKNIPFTIQMLSHLRYPFWPIVVNIIQRFIIPLTWK